MTETTARDRGGVATGAGQEVRARAGVEARADLDAPQVAVEIEAAWRRGREHHV